MFGRAVSPSPLINQMQALAQNALYQASLYKETQNFEMALIFYGHAKVAFKRIAKARQITPSLSQVKDAVIQAQTPETAEDEALRQRIAQVYFERSQLLKKLGDEDKAKASYQKAQKWGYQTIPAVSATDATSSANHAISLVPSSAFFLASVSLTPSPQISEAHLHERHQWVAQVFETILKQFQDLDLCQSSPSLFLVYAHNNELGKADAEVSQCVIQWLSNLRSNLYSDRSASGHQALPLPATPEDTAKANDILSSQLCLLPNHAGTVDHVVLCGSELLGHYMVASPYYQGFCEEIQRAYQEASQQHANDFTQVEAAIRKVVEANINEAEFHHVLTELAFLQIRYEHKKGEHGIIPLLLNSRALQCLPKFILDSTTIRIEDSRWRTPNLWNGRQTYQDEGLHIGFFKLLKRLFVKQERYIDLVEKKIYQACLQKLREDQSHMLTAEVFSLFLNQACVTALEALKQDHSADLRELNVQKAYESILTEIKQINGEALIAPDQLRSALAASYSSKGLDIQRLSGPALSMEHCYINLAIVEYEKIRKEEEKPKEEKVVPDPFHRLPSFEAIHSNQQKLVPLEKLFDPRALSKDKTVTPKRILIRGRAGVGKTTLSKKIVYEYTQKGQWRDRFDHVLWISLRTLKGKSNYDLVTLFHETYFQHHPKGLALAKTLEAQINGPAKEKTLFVLDGWDEVAQEWGEYEPMAEFLKHLLNQPAVLITSRPYVDLKQAQPMDLELETVGFSPENVAAYLDNPGIVSTAEGKEIKHFIQSTPLIQGLVNVPIQLDALCYSWDEIKRLQQEAQGSVTVTSLYQAMMNKLWRKDMQRLGKQEGGKLLTAEAVNALRSAPRIEQAIKVENDFLSTLAFKGLQDNRIEFNTAYVDDLIEQLVREGVSLPLTLEDNLKKLSFLHTDDAEEGQRSYHFMHLTFQEFFAAKHFVQCWETGQEISLLSAGTKRWTKASAEAFVRQHKYNPRYEMVWWFVSGLLRGQALNRFFDVLEAEPRDLFGASHQRLMVNCLHEASRSPDVGLSSDIRDRLMPHLAQWLQLEIDQTGEGTLAYQPTFPEHLLLECLKKAASAETKIAVANIFGHRSALLESAIQALIALVKGKNEGGYVRGAAVDALGPQSSLEALQALIALATDKNEDTYVKRTVASALGQQSSLPPEALQALIALAKDSAEYVRIAAASALGQQSSLPPEALQALIALATDENEDVRIAAADALDQQSSLPPEALQALIALATDSENNVRRAAASALGQQSSLPPEALQALIALAKDSENNVRRAAASALGEHSSLSPEALQALIALAKDSENNVRRAAASALGQQSSLPPEALQALIALAKGSTKYVRRAAASALGQHSSLSPEALQALIALAKDDDWDMRHAAALALGEHSSLPPEALQTLIALATDSAEYVRRAVASALGEHSSLSPEALQALIALAKDSAEYVRIVAADALGQHSLLPPEALQTLIALAKDKNEDTYVRHAAAKALGQQSSLPLEALQALIALAKDEDRNVRCAAASALGQHSSLPLEALQTLIALAKDKNENVRYAVADALCQHSSLPPEALQALIALAKDSAEYVRIAAAKALGQQSSLPPEAFQTLIALAKDKDWKVWGAAAKALGQHSSLSPEALQAWIALATDESGEVRRTAAGALGQQSSLPPEALQALIALATDKNWEVGRAAASALDKHRWTLYRLLPTLNRKQIALIYTRYLLQQRFDQSVPFYIQDSTLCFYNTEGLQSVPFNHADSEVAFKQAVQQTQQALGIPPSPT